MTRLSLYAIGGLSILAGLWWVQHRISISYSAERERDVAVTHLSNYKTAVENAARVAAAQQAADQKADADLNSQLSALQDDNEKLRRALSRLPSTVEKPDAHGIPRLSISGNWWLCHSAQVTRDPADSAACEASGSASDVPNTISR